MAPPRPKRFEFAAAVDLAGDASAEGGTGLATGPEWQAEHFLLASLLRCSITSLRYQADRAGIEVQAAGSARGVITKRESDGRYAFVEIECTIDAFLDPLPPESELAALLDKAERDCFVGASLTAPPRYEWRVAT
jgi:uncharacterized OsmC-like protein